IGASNTVIPTLLPLWKRWQETHEALLDCLEQFPEDRFHWQPAPTAASAASILVHIARGETVYALQIAPGATGPPELSYSAQNEAIALQRRAELAASVTSREDAARLLQAAAGFAIQVAKELREEDLERVLADDWNPLGPEVEGPLNVLWFLEQ